MFAVSCCGVVLFTFCVCCGGVLVVGFGCAVFVVRICVCDLYVVALWCVALCVYCECMRM